ncbi:MAG: ChbG/HpnK family deacetylase [Candidatus Gastranaerophilales bacterium]|nr:ChbG/HpnK family deacetylase [Candidatus Gastranaerophilales bacterium]
MKKLIINADDFGYSKENNEAIKLGYEAGIITSTSLIANMQGFEHAVLNILPQMQSIDVGFHFNIIEGKSLTNQSMLCDKEGNFNNNYLQLILKSNNKEFIKQTEIEFRAQFEKLSKHSKISHIDSHVHTASIPNIHKLITRLAKEYNIKYIRTPFEKPYIVLKKSFNIKFVINILKNILLNTFSLINKKEIKTNDYFIGVLYTGMMDENTIINGLKGIKKENSITEIIFHPTIDKNRKNNYREFQITQNPNLKKEIKNLGFELTTYTKYYQESEQNS